MLFALRSWVWKNEGETNKDRINIKTVQVQGPKRTRLPTKKGSKKTLSATGCHIAFKAS